LAAGLSYGGAVYYALKSDNFHDFFTEYVPFGEEAVLYFEERQFHKRFPNARINQNRIPQSAQRDGNKVTIPSKSGISWKVSDEPEAGGSDLSQKGRHMSALDANKPGKVEIKNAQQTPSQADKKEKSAAVEVARKKADAPKDAPAPPPTPQKIPERALEPAGTPSPATPSPKSDSRPPAIAPVAQLSPLAIPNADEPVVQELAKIVNDLITVINADSPEASNKYSAPITKAKEALSSVGAKIVALKEAERQAADEKINEVHRLFDERTNEVAKRLDAARSEDLAKFRDEFESERERLSHSYAEKLKTEMDRAQQVSEQRLKNELTEQAIELKRKFVADIKSLVEQERDGRLSKLSELSTNVNDLQTLTSNWNGVIDSNLATQKLQVAVDAVRSSIARASANEGRPRPFLNELAALKEVANGDPIVDAAIASINPTAYQRGIPSPAQLIDRFRRVASEVRKASLLPESAGVASHAASLLLSKVMFKKAGHPDGGDVESVLTRTETLLEEGDLDAAAREMNTLQGWAGVLSKDWLQECRKVLEVRQALDVSDSSRDDTSFLTDSTGHRSRGKVTMLES
jgi:MICOS complex subunit MIC60